MIPVMQDRQGNTGNCFAACLASLLELPLHTIPDFGLDDDAEFIQHVQDWLQYKGYFYFRLLPDDPLLPSIFSGGSTWHTMEGISFRGGPHAVIGIDGEFVHDPHPGARPPGLKKLQYFGFIGQRML